MMTKASLARWARWAFVLAMAGVAGAAAQENTAPPSQRAPQEVPKKEGAKKEGAAREVRDAALAAKSVAPPDFRVGPGDVLRIDVWKEGEVSSEVVVRPDGHISLPLLKELNVNGLTPLEIQKAVTEALTKFIAAPDVTVIVRQVQSKKVYVVGQVRRNGPILLVGPMTVTQALAEAGGLTDYANSKNIRVLRNEQGRQTKLKFNYKDFLKGEGEQENILLLPGDTIVVP